MHIDLFANHNLYSNTFPVGSVPQGSITLDDGSTGALVYISAGDGIMGHSVMVNTGCVRNIDQAALRKITG